MYTPTVTGMDPSGVGVDGMQALTLYQSQPDEPTFAAEADQNTAAAVNQQGNPHLVLVGLIAGLIGLNYLTNHVPANGLIGAILRFTIVTLTVIVSVVILKVVFTKYPVPGITQVVHAI